MNEINQPAPPGKYLVDPYEDWAKAEGPPVHGGAAVDLLTADVKPWPRFGVNGAFCHLDGRDDFLAVFLIELPANSASTPQQHLYEEVTYVLTGAGITEYETPDGRTRTIEWRARSLFALPMNARYRHRNTSAKPARLAAVNDLRYLLNLYRSEEFIFATPRQFAERYGAAQAVADIAEVEAGPVTLANGTIASDAVELPPGTYGQAYRQMHGAHLIGIDGNGYTLAWEEDPGNASRTDWRHGVLYAAPGMSFRQHFNTGTTPARFLDLQLGSRSYPMFRHRRAAYGDSRVYAAGSATIPFARQDPRIHKLWLDAIAEKGITPRM